MAMISITLSQAERIESGLRGLPGFEDLAAALKTKIDRVKIPKTKSTQHLKSKAHQRFLMAYKAEYPGHRVFNNAELSHDGKKFYVDIYDDTDYVVFEIDGSQHYDLGHFFHGGDMSKGRGSQIRDEDKEACLEALRIKVVRLSGDDINRCRTTAEIQEFVREVSR